MAFYAYLDANYVSPTPIGIMCNVGQFAVYIFAAELLRMMCL